MDGSNLFRPEAIKQRSAALFGGVTFALGWRSGWVTLGTVALAACLIAVLVVGTYSRKERVRGYLIPSAGLVRVFAPRVGLISDLNVIEGQMVQAGDVLLWISYPREAASGIDVDQTHIDRLRAQHATIESKLNTERALASELMDSARNRISNLRAQSAEVTRQKESAARKVELLGREVKRLEALRGAGHAAISLLDGREVELLDARQDIIALDREINRIEGEISALKSETVQISLQLNVRLLELRSSLFDVQRTLAEAEAEQAVVVRTPIAGRVATLVAHVGMSIEPQRPLLSIVPIESELQAELLLPAHAAGFVNEGQEVLLRYDAFPYQKFGLQRGTILTVSHTVLNPEDQAGPVRLNAPAYRVVAGLEAQFVMTYGDRRPLQPGLTLQADIIRDRRRIIEWIFDPVIAAAKGI